LSGTGVVNRFLTEYKAGVHRTDVIGGRGSLHSMLMKAGSRDAISLGATKRLPSK
jgi:hypothetical protein